MWSASRMQKGFSPTLALLRCVDEGKLAGSQGNS
jgi:hypothetical protein